VGVGPGGEDAPRGADVPPPAAGEGHRDRLGTRGRIVAGVAFGVLYAVSFSIRGEVLPGLVGGLLGGVLVYLVFTEAENRARRRRQRSQDLR
jgi:hypothetical protein